MTEKPIARSENISENSVRIIHKDVFKGLSNEIKKIDENLGIYVKKDVVLVFWGGRISENNIWKFNSQNVVYYESELNTRDLKPAEKEWCNNTFIYSGDQMPDKIYYFDIPKPDALKKAIINNNLDKFPNLNVAIENKNKRSDIVESIQNHIAKAHHKKNQLSYQGNTSNLRPAWNPDNTDTDQENLRKLAHTKMTSHMESWKAVFDIPYTNIKETRYNHLDLYEPQIDGNDPSYKLVELDVLDMDQSHSYCQYCATVYPKEELLHVKRRGNTEKMSRTCEKCARSRKGLDFSEDEIARSIDKRAQENGGQRRLHDNF